MYVVRAHFETPHTCHKKNLLSSTVRAVRKNIKPRSCCLHINTARPQSDIFPYSSHSQSVSYWFLHLYIREELIKEMSVFHKNVSVSRFRDLDVLY
jgi:hypothetical protein